MLAGGHTPVLSDLFKKYNNYKVFLNYGIVSILSGLLIVVGFFIFILPGLYFMVKLQFVKTLVIDKDLNALDAIKKSWAMTNGNFWGLFLYAIAVVVFNFIGALLLGIGLLVTVPVTVLANIHLYKKFSGE
jgi:uncharacterized membrane protein